MINGGGPDRAGAARRLSQKVCKAGVSSNRARTVSLTVRGVTEPAPMPRKADATGPCPATIGLHDAPPHAGRVVRRMLLRRGIAIDAETAQLLAAAVQAVLQAEAPSRPRRRRPRAPATSCEPLF